MAMMTAAQYEESLRKLDFDVYLFGQRIENVVDHPIIRSSMNAVAMTYEMAHQPEYQDLMTATSHLSGERINRFTHIHQCTGDLVKKSKMGRLLFPALRGHGRAQCAFHRYFRYGPGVGHRVQPALSILPGKSPAQGPGL